MDTTEIPMEIEFSNILSLQSKLPAGNVIVALGDSTTGKEGKMKEKEFNEDLHPEGKRLGRAYPAGCMMMSVGNVGAMGQFMIGKKKKEAVWYEILHPESKRLETSAAYQCPICLNTPTSMQRYMLRTSSMCPPHHAICETCVVGNLEPKKHRLPKTAADQRYEIRCVYDDTAYDPRKLYAEEIPPAILLKVKEKVNAEKKSRVEAREDYRQRAIWQSGTMLTCRVCSAHFRTNQAKKNHYDQAHLGRFHECDGCQRRCSGKYKLEKHRDVCKMKQYHCRNFCYFRCEKKVKPGFKNKRNRDVHEEKGCVTKEVTVYLGKRVDE